MSGKTRSELLKSILSIGRDASIRGEGLSLREAIRRVRYVTVRETITAEELAEVLRNEATFVDDWILFCDDKRTSGGWVLTPETKEIWLFLEPDERYKFDSIEAAVANYVLAELDYWTSVGAA